MKTIIITGSPGTGKTRLAKKLAKQKHYEYINVAKLVKQGKLYDKYDRKRRTYVVDTKKLNKFLIEIIKTYKNNKIKGIIIDSHMSHFLPKKYVDLCIVTKCELKKLKKRLQKRKYNKAKIRENLDCEIFDVCLTEAKERKHKIKVVDTNKRKKT
tara:strand:- start:5440 stop:5904 length:465 start_codon:yes stop_codon:yes gene_type:complete